MQKQAQNLVKDLSFHFGKHARIDDQEIKINVQKLDEDDLGVLSELANLSGHTRIIKRSGTGLVIIFKSKF
jgi:hypothetical protein